MRSSGPASSSRSTRSADRVDDVLAVVEDDDRRVTPHPLGERVDSAGDAQRGDDRVDDLLACASRSRAGRATSRPAGCSVFADRDRRGGLADPARSDDRDEAFGREAPTDRVDVVVAPDERRRERRQVARAPGAASASSCVRMRCSRSRSSGPGSSPSSSTRMRADPCAGGQRVRLATGLVEPGDHQRPEPLLVRVRLDRGLEVGEHARDLPSADGPRAASRAARAASRSAAPDAGIAQSPAAGNGSSPNFARPAAAHSAARSRSPASRLCCAATASSSTACTSIDAGSTSRR